MNKNLSLIFKAGLLVGTLDILAAFINFYAKTGKNVSIVLKYIASAVFGKEAMSGGTLMAAAGLLFHYLIAFSFTALFALLYPKLWQWFKSVWLITILYGVFIWLLMNLIIVPSTRAPQIPFSWSAGLVNCLILALCIGLPLAYLFRKNDTANSPKN
ncbi:hypothetical protein VRU48_18735 [Pedobacter sp. KR3-3]|uniref:DUF1440 domain-containing protein n=1 Tax=Pedobacter albus TaxID=3113905 RepID=A0ABU7ICF7_9SPHI|nr:hypothetical protein [Pedobacter sp. KR3-3]MEE1947170.1 hypothetical protein [Pedobacter sp. KR3-3]